MILQLKTPTLHFITKMLEIIKIRIIYYLLTNINQDMK